MAIATPATTGPTDTDRFTLSVTFEMNGIDWDYVNRLHSHYRFHEDWPPGMLAHVTSEFDGGIRSVGLWTNRLDEQTYFRQTAIPVITDSIMEMGPAVAGNQDAAIDFEPVSRTVDHLTVSGLARAFADIGADEDASAIHALGGQPVVVRIELGDSAPTRASGEGLIAAWSEHDDDVRIETQVWATTDHAESAGALETELPLSIDRLKRVSFGADELDAAGV